MPKRRLFSGVIDLVTIIGVLFLIITLSVGTYVLTDKKYNFDIFEKAAVLECFPAGTKITLENGEVKNIQEFEVGDKVISEDEDGNKELSNTQKLWKLWSLNMCSVDFESGEKLKLTNPHPLYTQEGWKAINVKSAKEHNPDLAISQLTESDSVKKQNGSWDKITSISCEYGLFRVYNLAVDNNNNYYAEGYLAHNKKSSVVDKGAGTTTVLDEGGLVVKQTEKVEKVIDRENVTVVDTTRSLPRQVISPDSPAYIPPVTVPEVPTTKTEEPTTGGSCTALCLQNASIDECLCTSKQIQDLGIVVPSQAYLDQNGSSGNDGKFLENGSEVIVPGSIADIPPISPAKPPAPVVTTGKCVGKTADYEIGAIAVFGGEGSYKKCVVENGVVKWTDCPVDDAHPECRLANVTNAPAYLQEQQRQDQIEQYYEKEIALQQQANQGYITPDELDIITRQQQELNRIANIIPNTTGYTNQNEVKQNTTITIPSYVTSAVPNSQKAIIPNYVTGATLTNPQNIDTNKVSNTSCANGGATPEQKEICRQLAIMTAYNSNYVQSYLPNKVIYNYELKGYNSISDCQKGEQTYLGKQSCDDYQLTKDQATSSVKLGTDIASVITLPLAPAVFGPKSLLMLGLGTFGGTMTVQQTKNAVVAQIEDPGFLRAREDINPNGFWETIDPQTYLTDAGYQTTMATLGWLNLGTADDLMRAWGPTGNAITQQSARVANTIVSGVNLAVDTPYAINTCTEAGLLTTDCAFAGGVLATDIIFGGLDYYQGQLTLNPIRAVTETIDAITPSLVNVNRLANNPLNEIQIPSRINTTSIPVDYSFRGLTGEIGGWPIDSNLSSRQIETLQNIPSGFVQDVNPLTGAPVIRVDIQPEMNSALSNPSLPVRQVDSVTEITDALQGARVTNIEFGPRTDFSPNAFSAGDPLTTITRPISNFMDRIVAPVADLIARNITEPMATSIFGDRTLNTSGVETIVRESNTSIKNITVEPNTVISVNDGSNVLFAPRENPVTNQGYLADLGNRVLDNINESFSNFWQNNVYSWTDGFLPNWTRTGLGINNPIANFVFGNPRNILADLPTPWQRVVNFFSARPEDINLRANNVTGITEPNSEFERLTVAKMKFEDSLPNQFHAQISPSNDFPTELSIYTKGQNIEVVIDNQRMLIKPGENISYEDLNFYYRGIDHTGTPIIEYRNPRNIIKPEPYPLAFDESLTNQQVATNLSKMKPGGEFMDAWSDSVEADGLVYVRIDVDPNGNILSFEGTSHQFRKTLIFDVNPQKFTAIEIKVSPTGDYYKPHFEYRIVTSLAQDELPDIAQESLNRTMDVMNGRVEAPQVNITQTIEPPTQPNWFQRTIFSPSAGVWDGVKNWLQKQDVIGIIDDIPWIPNSVKIALRGIPLDGNNGLKINIPKDAEQIAAETGTITKAQQDANQNMEAQIAGKVEKALNSGESAKKRLQTGYDEVQERARAAREEGLSALEQNKPKPSSTKWTWWQGGKKKTSGQVLTEFGATLPFILAVPVAGVYLVDRYFDLGIFDKITNTLSGNPIAKSLGAALNSGTFPILKPLAPILPLPNTNFENINYNPDINIDPAETETEVKPQGLTINKANEDTSCTRIDRSNPCDGERIYQTYLEYKEQFGEITPAQFLAIILMTEARGADPEFLKSIALATSSQLWGSSPEHEAYCKTPTCEEGIFNFIGAYMEAGANKYNTILYEKDPEKIKALFNLDHSTIDYFNQNGISIDQIANDTIYNPVSTVFTNDTPTQWGNFGCGEKCEYLGPNWIKEANQKEINTGTTDRCGLYDVVGQEDSLAVVFTVNQKHNWSIKNPDCFGN